MAVVASFRANGRRLPFDLEVIGFAEEEGMRYGSTFLGSSAYIGRFDPALLAKKDSDGIAMRDAIRAVGLDPDRIAECAVDLTRLQRYFEVHIEQGPVLLNRDLPLGVVTAIAGSVRQRLVLTGQAGHSGTTPMGMRRDAACAAAEIVLYVERRCAEVPGLVGTVGQIDVPGGSINVIPGRCHLSVDVRAGEIGVLHAAMADINRAIADIAARRGIVVQSEEILRSAPVACALDDQRLWAQAIAAESETVFHLPSGAGHDAMRMAEVVPSSMLFVRCGNGGISHDPSEIVSLADVQSAARVTARYLEMLGLGGGE
jgi:hydantoinase/carbamoylase family amidase